MNRSNYLGSLRTEDISKEVCLYGWVKNIRNFGEIVFIDLSDQSGYSQIVIEDSQKELLEICKDIRNQFTLKIEGTVRERSDKNLDIPTGEVEVVASNIEVINKAKPVAVDLEDDTQTQEETRLTYRYLDLRRKPMLENLKTRHQVSRSIRNFLDSNDFLEVETPLLTKSTPEGARDFLVPSRINKTKFYALPQSPQIYKNLLMNASIDRYYQFSRCFRDEDLRSDRQPEFTQIDIEMAFMSQEEIREIMEKMIKKVMSEVFNINYYYDFIQMTYKYAMDHYGVDKPDVRFAMHLVDLTSVFKDSEFKIFSQAEYVKAIKVEKAADKYSRKDLAKLEELVKKYQAKGMPWLKYTDGEFKGSIVKVLTSYELEQIKLKMKVEENDLLIFASDNYNVVSAALGNLRNELGKQLNLYEENDFRYLWIVDWPLFEYDEEDERYYAMHHPFTMPKGHKFSESVENQQALAYDIVLNGFEIGGGSIRINNNDLQMQMFELLGFTKEQAEEEFGFLLEAYKYGAPYHGGIAFGFDRWLMVLTNSSSIKEVIAFPKNNRGVELLMDSPSVVDQAQLDEVSISVKKVEE